MGNCELQPEGDRIRKAVRWICDTLAMYPDKTRDAVIKDAGIRFDLTPKECSFLDRKLTDQAENGSNC